MRLRYVLAQGFRGFADEIKVDLDADVVLLVGENGRGKTTIFDAILWCLTGSVSRITGGNGKLLSLFSRSGEMRVEVGLRADDGTELAVSRRFDGSATFLQLDKSGRITNNERAQLDLLDALSKENPFDELDIADAFVRSTYLQQDLVKEFMDAGDDQERFQAFADLLGAGKVADLQLALDKAKTAWVSATTRLRRETKPDFDRLADLRFEVARVLDAQVESTLDAEWQTFVTMAAEAGLGISNSLAPSGNELESLLAQTQIRLRLVSDRANRLRELVQAIAALPPSQELKIVETRDTEANATLQRELAVAALDEANAHLAEVRAVYEESTDHQERLKLLAELAVDLLDDHCPVCGQTHDISNTQRRLQDMIGAGSPDSGSVEQAQESVRTVSQRLAAADVTLKSSRREHEEILFADQLRKSGLSTIAERAKALGLAPESDTQELLDAAKALLGSDTLAQTSLESLQGEAERLALKMAEVTASQRRSLLQGELEAATRLVAAHELDFRIRERAADYANAAIPALRDAADAVVENEVRRLEPVFQMIYSAIDPHPAFTGVRLDLGRTGRNARLSTRVVDPETDAFSSTPMDVLSSSQSNALAVSLFLALNLSAKRRPLDSVLLDDPMQSMDSVHLLGLVDILRRVASRRQLLVSTHDTAFGDLLARKLRPVDGAIRSALIVRISGWTRRGPTLEYRSPAVDSKPLRIAS